VGSDQAVFERLNHAAVVEGFTQQLRATAAGGVLAVEHSADGPAAGECPGGRAFTQASGSLESYYVSKMLTIKDKNRHLRFQTALMNKAG